MPISAMQSDVDSGAVRETFCTCPVIAGRSLNAGVAADAGAATAAKPATVVVTTVATAARDTIEMSFIGTSRARNWDQPIRTAGTPSCHPSVPLPSPFLDVE